MIRASGGRAAAQRVDCKPRRVCVFSGSAEPADLERVDRSVSAQSNGTFAHRNRVDVPARRLRGGGGRRLDEDHPRGDVELPGTRFDGVDEAASAVARKKMAGDDAGLLERARKGLGGHMVDKAFLGSRAAIEAQCQHVTATARALRASHAAHGA